MDLQAKGILDVDIKDIRVQIDLAMQELRWCSQFLKFFVPVVNYYQGKFEILFGTFVNAEKFWKLGLQECRTLQTDFYEARILFEMGQNGMDAKALQSARAMFEKAKARYWSHLVNCSEKGVELAQVQLD